MGINLTADNGGWQIPEMETEVMFILEYLPSYATHNI